MMLSLFVDEHVLGVNFSLSANRDVWWLEKCLFHLLSVASRSAQLTKKLFSAVAKRSHFEPSEKRSHSFMSLVMYFN